MAVRDLGRLLALGATGRGRVVLYSTGGDLG